MSELENRMRSYEETYRIYLMYGPPKILRVDMRSGKSFTKNLRKPFDDIFSDCMIETMKQLCRAVPGARLGYTQSDEISIVLKDINDENQEVAFFKNSLTKIISNVASMATLVFNIEWDKHINELCRELGITVDNISDESSQLMKPYLMNRMTATFDCRYFELPNIEEVQNYFIWRQKDCYRNSVNQIARVYFTQGQLDGVHTDRKLELLETVGVKPSDFPNKYFKGVTCFRVKEMRNGVERLSWKDFGAPSFYNNYEFIKNIYKELIF